MLIESCLLASSLIPLFLPRFLASTVIPFIARVDASLVSALLIHVARAGRRSASVGQGLSATHDSLEAKPTLYPAARPMTKLVVSQLVLKAKNKADAISDHICLVLVLRTGLPAHGVRFYLESEVARS